MVKTNFLLSKTRKKRILFDMDDVLVDFVPEVLNRYNKLYKTNFKIKDVTNWDMKKTFGKKIIDIVFEKDIFLNLKFKKDSEEVFKRMYESNKYDMYIITACNPQGYLEKVKWVQNNMSYFPIDRIIPCNDKSLVWGDILIDDKIENLNNFSKIGECILYTMPHNLSNKTYKRIENLIELENILNELENKKEYIS